MVGMLTLTYIYNGGVCYETRKVRASNFFSVPNFNLNMSFGLKASLGTFYYVVHIL
jgi:hypothetical protein